MARRFEEHFQHIVSCYVDRPRNLDHMFRSTVSRRPAQQAVLDNGMSINYEELNRRVDSVAIGLSQTGVVAGDRIALMLPNGLTAVVCLLAIARIGAVLVPVGERLRAPEITHMLTDSQAVVFVFASSLEHVLPDSESISAKLICDGETEHIKSLSLSTFVEKAPHDVPDFPERDEDDVFAILYTSGTTGRPKGAMLTNLGAVHSCQHWVDRLSLSQDERSALCIPWSHVAGLCGVVLPILFVGGTIVTLSSFDKRSFLRLAADQRITHALLVPAMYSLCLLDAELPTFDLSSWRIGVYGSAPMPEETIRRFARAVPHLQMCNAYGATETTSPVTIMPPGQGEARKDSIGLVVECGEVLVMDESGRELPRGEAGELWIKGPMVVPGYWRNDKANESSFIDGFWRSGDIGSMDADGYVYIADRSKDVVNRGGFKVYPAEIENTLSEIPDVVEAAVVGIPDEILGENVVAFVRSLEGLDEARVREFCSTRLADYKVPKFVVVSQDALPRNANGKLQKDILRDAAKKLRRTDLKV